MQRPPSEHLHNARNGRHSSPDTRNDVRSQDPSRVLPLFPGTMGFTGIDGPAAARGPVRVGEIPAPDAGEGRVAGGAPADPVPEALRDIIRRRDTWLGLDLNRSRAANHDQHDHPHLATGFAALDARLCEGGWPLGTCIEVLTDACGMGAMGLFLPAMQTLSQQARWQAFIAPPYTPYAPLLAAREIDTQQVLLVHPRDREEQLWSTEQALRSGTCSAVFSWLGHGEYRYAELRRLQLAAARGDTLAVLFRPRDAAHQHAPASLRLEMQAYRDVRSLKLRCGLQGTNVYLPPEDDIPHQPQLWELPADVGGADTRAVS